MLVATLRQRGLPVVKVVLVDDSIAVQRRLEKLLASVGGVEVVGCAEDVSGALLMIEAARPDVIVLDVSLRDGDRGMNVLRHVVRHYPVIKVVVLSNFTWGAMRDGFIGAGASAYFDKSTEFLAARDWIAGLAGAAARRAGSTLEGSDGR